MNTIIFPVRDVNDAERGKISSIHQIFKEKNLYFSIEEELGNNLFALDLRKQRLFYFNKENKISKMLIINLRNISSCNMVRHYTHTAPVRNKMQGFLGYLKKICLGLNIKSGVGQIELPIYEFNNNSQEEILQFEEKAKNWSEAVSRILYSNTEERIN